ncbi:MAG: hypothetical protein ACLPKB_28245 [Xanthobacteraceae bacterium]
MEFFRTVVILAALAAGEWMPDNLATLGLAWVTGIMPAPWVKIGCWVVIALLVLVIDYVVRRYDWMLWWMRDPQLSRAEGVWFQKVAIPERPYSIGRIEYSGNGRWAYSGVGYGDKFEPKADWQTASLGCDSQSKKWYFAGQAHLLKYDAHLKRYQWEHTGYVNPILDLHEASHIAEHDGTVVDLDLNKENRIFTIALTRADRLFPKRLWIFPRRLSVDDMKRMEPSKVQNLFTEMKLL